MAQNINIGGEWQNVPGVNLPKDGGGTAYFADPSVTTAIEEDVMAGKKFLKVDGSIGTGTGQTGAGAFSHIVEELPGGGEHHIITGVDISQDTVTAEHLEAGYTAHDAEGNQITGVLDPSSWELLASQEFTVSTTSTSNASVGNIQLPDNNYGQEDILLLHIRDKAGKRAGYIYGSDTFFFNYKLADGDTSYMGVRPVTLFYVNADGIYTGVVTAYGVYGYRLYYTSTAHYIMVYRRYNANYGTIDGTFKCDVYKLKKPSGMTLFE